MFGIRSSRISTCKVGYHYWLRVRIKKVFFRNFNVSNLCITHNDNGINRIGFVRLIKGFLWFAAHFWLSTKNEKFKFQQTFAGKQIVSDMNVVDRCRLQARNNCIKFIVWFKHAKIFRVNSSAHG